MAVASRFSARTNQTRLRSTHPRLLKIGLISVGVVVALAACSNQATPPRQASRPMDVIDTVVVIYAENRSFDNLYGNFPGADGLQTIGAGLSPQLDRDGTVLTHLPPIWGGLTAKGVTPAITQAMTEHLANAPFAIDDAKGFALADTAISRDLWHRFYENQMQINGGKNDKFVAYADSGALVMGHYDGSKMAMWQVARKYTLADHFFMGAFGGSFLNHQWLACACVPYYPEADKSPAKPSIAKVEADGVTLTPAANMPSSALKGAPKFAADGNLTPDFYAVNTMQPPYQPSANKPAQGGDPAYADPMAKTTLPPQHDETIGEALSDKGVSWAWYAGAWSEVLEKGNNEPVPNFQYHHQPYNYFATFAPGTAARTEHLRDGGLNGDLFIKAIDAGQLPQVSFYKPQGNLNQHAGYAAIEAGDAHIADVISHLEKSPQWAHMLVIVTYDENGGFWDHVAPPKADRWGPGTRIPAILIGPMVKRGYVDHTPYDTTSILKFLTERYGLAQLPGIKNRDAGLQAHGNAPLGDFTAALQVP